MTTEQRLHAENLAKQFTELMLAKYEKGQAEHGGNLWESDKQTLIYNAIDEAIDQVVYLLTLREKL